jgi:hypothetical protein
MQNVLFVFSLAFSVSRSVPEKRLSYQSFRRIY